VLELYEPTQRLRWGIPARLQGTSKLKINPAAAGRQVKETQQKEKKKKGKERTDESCLMTIM